MKKKDYYLETFNYIKTIMMLLIILYHSMALWLPDGWFNQPPQQKNLIISIIAQWLNLLHVYVFTFVSGYIYKVLRFEKGKYTTFLNFLINKIRRLLYPYLGVSLFWCIPFYMYFFKPSKKDIVIKFLLGYSPSQLWYLLMLFFLFLSIYGTGKLFCNIKLKYLYFICFSIYGIYIVLSAFISLPFQILTAIKYIPFFILGMNYEKIINAHKWNTICLLVFNIILFVIWSISRSELIYIKIIKSSIAYFVSVTGILFSIKFIFSIKNMPFFESSLYHFLERNNFKLYLFHQQIIWIIIDLLNSKASPWMIVAVNFIISIGLLSIVIMLIEYMKKKRIIDSTQV